VTALIRGSNSNTPGGPYRKPRADFYTVALVLALIALILAIVCLWVLMGAYDKQFKGAPVPTFSPQAPPAGAPVTWRGPAVEGVCGTVPVSVSS
jgi:hypothetical protein